jgi:predicted dehydrogenase
MNKGTIKTGILSFGMSGKIFHSPFVNEHKDFELYAVVERTKKKAHLIYPNIKSYNSIEELIADPEIELVIVNTPNITHFDFALKAIKAGKHVLMEKPFTVKSSEAGILFKEAKRYNCHILPYQNRRYDSDFSSVKSVLNSGKLGRLVEFHLRYDRYKNIIGHKIMKETPVPGSGLAYDLGPHLLDAVISVFGKPLEWRKKLGYFRPKTQVDDYAYFHLSYPDDFQVFITMSMLVSESQPAFVIHGTKGSYIKQRTDVQERQLTDGITPSNSLYGVEELGKHGVFTSFSNDGVKIQEKILSPKSSYMQVFNDVYNTIREGKSYPVTENEIMLQLKILEG